MPPGFVSTPARLLRGLGSARRGMGAKASCPSRRATIVAATGVESGVRAAIKQNNVMVFSTSWCPYCRQVKSLFSQLGVEHTVWELDERPDGSDIRAFLLSETGQRTVPNVFIKEKHIGGCDDTMDLHEEGKLLELVAASAS